MAMESGKQITLKLMVDGKNNRVVFAETDEDFVDILFSFLTMPMGTIVRLLNQKSQSATATIGSFTSLYRGVVDFESKYLWTKYCKKMLLHPQNSAGTLVQKLELNIDDTEPTRYFKSSCPKNHASTVKGVICSCRRILKEEFFTVHQYGDELGEVFVNSNSLFAICDDLKVCPASCFSNDTIFNTLGISDTKVLHLKTVTVGLEEVYRLLELSLRSKSPLTDMFLRDQGFSSTSTSFGSLHFKKNEEEEGTSSNCKQMTVKLIVRKHDNKVLYAEAVEDFIDFLFGLLTVPLGSVVELLGGNSSLGCVDNLYKSAGDLDVPRFIGSDHRKAMLISPRLPPKYLCKNQLLDVKEVDITPLNLLDLKSLTWDTASNEGYVKGPATFMVTDDLVVTPLSSISKVLLLNSLNLGISSLEERVISVGKKEALSLLKASLISSSALTIGLNSIFKEPKQEYVIAMSAQQESTVSLKIFFDIEKNRVVLAEADKHFVDILLSFLTLPLGTIIRLVSQQSSSSASAKFGCLNNLYESVENLDLTEICKNMLLHPRNIWAALLKNLKVNVDDSEPIKYFICSEIGCSRRSNGASLSNYCNARCSCGKLMNMEIKPKDFEEINKEFFITGDYKFIITDDLHIMHCSPLESVKLLNGLGARDVKQLEEQMLTLDLNDIKNLLYHLLISDSPLTDVFLAKKKSNSSNAKRRVNNQYLPLQNVTETAAAVAAAASQNSSDKNISVKVLVSKSDNRVFYAEAREDFIDFLFSFLTIPLGSVLVRLGKDCGLGCIDNLYKSMVELNDEWLVELKEEMLGLQLFYESAKDVLCSGVAPHVSCRIQPLNISEEMPLQYYCYSEVASDNTCSYYLTTSNLQPEKIGVSVSPLTLIDPRIPTGGFVKRPAMFIVSDDLKVTPLSSYSVSCLKSLENSINDLEERLISIGEIEAMNLLQSCLNSTSALTEGLN